MENLSRRAFITGTAATALAGPASPQQKFTYEDIYSNILNMENYVLKFCNSSNGKAIRRDINKIANNAYNRTGGIMDLLTPSEIDIIHFNNVLNNYINNSYLDWPPEQRLQTALCTLDTISKTFERYELYDFKQDLDKARDKIYKLYRRQSARQCSRAYELGAN